MSTIERPLNRTGGAYAMIHREGSVILDKWKRVATLFVAVAASACAENVTYVYTGPDYDIFTVNGKSTEASKFTPQEGLTFSFTLPSALSPLTEFSLDYPVVPPWSSFDGIYSESSSDSSRNAAYLVGDVTTDAQGVIVNWNISFGSYTVRQDGVTLDESICNVTDPNQCENNLTYPAFDAAYVVENGKYYAAGTTSAGTWSVVDTPEPSSVLLGSAGLLSAFFIRRLTSPRRPFEGRSST